MKLAGGDGFPESLVPSNKSGNYKEGHSPSSVLALAKAQNLHSTFGDQQGVFHGLRLSKPFLVVVVVPMVLSPTALSACGHARFFFCVRAPSAICLI